MTTQLSDAFFDLFSIAIIQTDERGTITEANELLCKLSGWRREELVGQPLEVLVPQASRLAHRGFRAGYLADPTPRPMGGPGRDVRLLRADGEAIRVWIALAPTEGGVVAVILPAPPDIPTQATPASVDSDR